MTAIDITTPGSDGIAATADAEQSAALFVLQTNFYGDAKTTVTLAPADATVNDLAESLCERYEEYSFPTNENPDLLAAVSDCVTTMGYEPIAPLTLDAIRSQAPIPVRRIA